MEESFYDWCIRTNHQSFLLRWDNDKNNASPKEVSKSDIHKYYFKCENCISDHPSELHDINHIVLHEAIPKCKVCGSFGYWCQTHSREDLLKRWDYEKNTVSPFQISISSTFKQYFKCPRGIHDSELKDLNNIRKQYGSSVCKQCHSIGQYGIDNIDRDFIKDYWSEKNDCDSLTVNRNSQKKIWIKCQENSHHKDYELSAVNFYKGKRCPYCAGKKVSIDDSIGKLYPQSINVWSDKNNDITPFDVLPKSNKRYWWKCPDGKHNDFRRKACEMLARDYTCPKCARENHESILQHKVRVYLESIFDVVNHEGDCMLRPINPKTQYPLYYDNEIPEIKLIIEVNGEQHYKCIDWFYHDSDNPEQQLEYRKYLDSFKEEYAIQHGYNFLAIPYYYDNKQERWKHVIDTTIKQINENKS